MHTSPEGEVPKANEQPEPETAPKLQCTCVQDPFVALPPELRPRPQNATSDLRRVTCPGCGLIYRTNRTTDLCLDCENKGVRLPKENIKTGG